MTSYGKRKVRATEIETWLIQVVDSVRAGRRQEDARVELKTTWPEPERAARRIAGQANNSRGEHVLWIIGMQEDGRILELPPREVADWWAQVRTQFEGVAPGLTDLVVPYESQRLVALLFDTSRFPFVVRNPAYGKPEGGPVALEVPWREGTAIRSARRDELLRLLIPSSQLPDVEILSGYLVPYDNAPSEPPGLRWYVHLDLYLTPKTAERVVIPFHRCNATVQIDGLAITKPGRFRLEPPQSRSYGFWGQAGGGSRMLHSLTIDNTSHELIADGPGALYLIVDAYSERVDLEALGDAHVEIRLVAAYAASSVSLDARLKRSDKFENGRPKWIVS